MRLAAHVGFVRWYDEARTLASGRESHIYVEGRQDTTENPAFLDLVCRKILQDTNAIMAEDEDDRRARFIGIPHVAHGWTPAITMVDFHSKITPHGACHAIMRSELKEHGGRKGKWVAGSPQPGKYRDFLFDNVVTDAGSKQTALSHLIEDGWRSDQIDTMVFVDRQQGGLTNMEQLGFRRVHACYFLLDMTFAFRELGLWPADAVERVEEEIAAHQLAK